LQHYHTSTQLYFSEIYQHILVVNLGTDNNFGNPHRALRDEQRFFLPTAKKTIQEAVVFLLTIHCLVDELVTMPTIYLTI
jgi:hypothetical protein